MSGYDNPWSKVGNDKIKKIIGKPNEFHFPEKRKNQEVDESKEKFAASETMTSHEDERTDTIMGSANKKINEEITSKTDDIIYSLKTEIAQYKSKLGAILPEITKYQKVIDSLKAEISEYKSKLDMLAFTTQQKSIDSLKAEISEYKSTLNDIFTSTTQQKSIDSLKAEISEYKSKLDMLAFTTQQKNNDSLREEISEYKAKFDTIVPEITQYHRIIDSLKAEISEYKNRDIHDTSSGHVVSDQQILSSLSDEIAKLKRNLELLSLE